MRTNTKFGIRTTTKFGIHININFAYVHLKKQKKGREKNRKNQNRKEEKRKKTKTEKPKKNHSHGRGQHPPRVTRVQSRGKGARDWSPISSFCAEGALDRDGLGAMASATALDGLAAVDFLYVGCEKL